MKFIRIGLTTGNHASLLHDFVYVGSQNPLLIIGSQLHNEQLSRAQAGSPVFSFYVNQPLKVEAKSNVISIADGNGSNKNSPAAGLPKGMSAKSNNISLVIIKPQSEQGKIILGTDKQFTHKRIYNAELMIIAQNNKIRLVLNCPLEEYVRSVLRAEVPANYHLQAIKAQAVSARTYALHPRVNHQQDLCDVCDSYLCCQEFSSWQAIENSNYGQASTETAGQILVYQDKPILSLFSSCAGGHTENYEDCFSDWATGIFPPPPLPYLKGVSESITTGKTDQFIDEAVLKRLWQSKNLSTVDDWSTQFRWSIHLSACDLESTMHHILSDLMAKKEFAPFIVSPPSRVFGNIESFSIDKRGVGGTAINMTVSTSKGAWQFVKELTIRSLFKNKSVNLERLPSAKIFFDQLRDDKQQLKSLLIYGLGHGHGVGLQQVGAQGMARLKLEYRQILSHYYTGAQIETI